MKQCSRLVRNLEFQLDNDQSLRGEDEYAHLKAITLLLNVYLKNVCKIVTELRSVHLKKTQYLNRICRLGNLVSMCGAKIDKRRLHDQQIKDQKQKELPKSSSFANMIRSVSSNSLEGKNFDGLKSDRLVSQPKDEPEKLDFDTADDQYPEDEAGEAHDVDLKPSEQAQLTAENQHLLERFIQRNSEIEQIETQFADLQKLQQTFIEKVLSFSAIVFSSNLMFRLLSKRKTSRLFTRKLFIHWTTWIKQMTLSGKQSRTVQVDGLSLCFASSF